MSFSKLRLAGFLTIPTLFALILGTDSWFSPLTKVNYNDRVPTSDPNIERSCIPSLKLDDLAVLDTIPTIHTSILAGAPDHTASSKLYAHAESLRKIDPKRADAFLMAAVIRSIREDKRQLWRVVYEENVLHQKTAQAQAFRIRLKKNYGQTVSHSEYEKARAHLGQLLKSGAVADLSDSDFKLDLRNFSFGQLNGNSKLSEAFQDFFPEVVGNISQVTNIERKSAIFLDKQVLLPQAAFQKNRPFYGRRYVPIITEKQWREKVSATLRGFSSSLREMATYSKQGGGIGDLLHKFLVKNEGTFLGIGGDETPDELLSPELANFTRAANDADGFIKDLIYKYGVDRSKTKQLLIALRDALNNGSKDIEAQSRTLNWSFAGLITWPIAFINPATLGAYFIGLGAAGTMMVVKSQQMSSVDGSDFLCNLGQSLNNELGSAMTFSAAFAPFGAVASLAKAGGIARTVTIIGTAGIGGWSAVTARNARKNAKMLEKLAAEAEKNGDTTLAAEYRRMAVESNLESIEGSFVALISVAGLKYSAAEMARQNRANASIAAVERATKESAGGSISVEVRNSLESHISALEGDRIHFAKALNELDRAAKDAGVSREEILARLPEKQRAYFRKIIERLGELDRVLASGIEVELKNLSSKITELFAKEESIHLEMDTIEGTITRNGDMSSSELSVQVSKMEAQLDLLATVRSDLQVNVREFAGWLKSAKVRAKSPSLGSFNELLSAYQKRIDAWEAETGLRAALSAFVKQIKESDQEAVWSQSKRLALLKTRYGNGNMPQQHKEIYEEASYKVGDSPKEFVRKTVLMSKGNVSPKGNFVDLIEGANKLDEVIGSIQAKEELPGGKLILVDSLKRNYLLSPAPKKIGIRIYNLKSGQFLDAEMPADGTVADTQLGTIIKPTSKLPTQWSSKASDLVKMIDQDNPAFNRLLTSDFRTELSQGVAFDDQGNGGMIQLITRDGREYFVVRRDSLFGDGSLSLVNEWGDETILKTEIANQLVQAAKTKPTGIKNIDSIYKAISASKDITQRMNQIKWTYRLTGMSKLVFYPTLLPIRVGQIAVRFFGRQGLNPNSLLEGIWRIPAELIGRDGRYFLDHSLKAIGLKRIIFFLMPQTQLESTYRDATNELKQGRPKGVTVYVDGMAEYVMLAGYGKTLYKRESKDDDQPVYVHVDSYQEMKQKLVEIRKQYGPIAYLEILVHGHPGEMQFGFYGKNAIGIEEIGNEKPLSGVFAPDARIRLVSCHVGRDMVNEPLGTTFTQAVAQDLLDQGGKISSSTKILVILPWEMGGEAWKEHPKAIGMEMFRESKNIYFMAQFMDRVTSAYDWWAHADIHGAAQIFTIPPRKKSK